jgi:hypothetical protein
MGDHLDYFHLNYPETDFFIGRFHTRLRQSTSVTLRARFAKWKPDIHGEPAIALVGKIAFLNLAINRLNANLNTLIRYLKTVPQDVEQCIPEHRALNIPEHDLLWALSLDTETFLFETRSAYELLGHFLKGFFALIFEREITERDILRAITDLGADTSWVPILRDSRQLFFHNAASWLAVERTNADPPAFDLLLLKRTGPALTPEDYVHFRDCRSIQQGLQTAINKIIIWIMNELAAIEHEEAQQA